MRLATWRVFLVYLVLAFVWLLPASLSPLSCFVSVGFSDASQVLWSMVNYDLFGSTFGHSAYPPKGVDFGYIHWVAVPLLVSKPLVAILGPVGAYNALLWLSVALSCFAAHLLALEEEVPVQGAWFCGAAFGLCPALAGQMMLGHFFNVFGAFLVPLYVLVFRKFFKGQEQKTTGILVVFLWLILLRSSHYYALFLIPVSVILGSFSVFLKKETSLKSAALLLLAGLLTSGLAVAQSKPSPDTELYLPRANVEFYDADLTGSVTPSPYHALWGESFERSGDRVTFCGFTVLLVALWAGLERKKPVFALLFLLLTIISWGPVAYWNGEALFRFPWAGLYELPGYSGIHVFARAALVAQIFLVVWAAPAIRKNSHLALILSLVLLEFWMAPQAVQDVRGAQILTELRQRPQGSVAYIPYQAANTTPLYYQVLHQKTQVRSAVLRPSFQLREFYAYVPYLAHFERVDGHKDLAEQGALELQVLLDLRYIILEKGRLGVENTVAWEQILDQRFGLASRWENEALLILELERLSGTIDHASFEFEASDRTYCSWGLGPNETRGSRTVRSVYGKSAQFWLPLNDTSAKNLVLRALSPQGRPALVFWNDHMLGALVTGSQWAKVHFKIPSEAVRVGVNELRIEVQGVTDPKLRSLDLDSLELD